MRLDHPAKRGHHSTSGDGWRVRQLNITIKLSNRFLALIILRVPCIAKLACIPVRFDGALRTRDLIHIDRDSGLRIQSQLSVEEMRG